MERQLVKQNSQQPQPQYLKQEVKKLLSLGLNESAQILGEFLVASFRASTTSATSPEDKAEGYVLFADALSANAEHFRAIQYFQQAIGLIKLINKHQEIEKLAMQSKNSNLKSMHVQQNLNEIKNLSKSSSSVDLSDGNVSSGFFLPDEILQQQKIVNSSSDRFQNVGSVQNVSSQFGQIIRNSNFNSGNQSGSFSNLNRFSRSNGLLDVLDNPENQNIFANQNGHVLSSSQVIQSPENFMVVSPQKSNFLAKNAEISTLSKQPLSDVNRNADSHVEHALQFQPVTPQLSQKKHQHQQQNQLQNSDQSSSIPDEKPEIQEFKIKEADVRLKIANCYQKLGNFKQALSELECLTQQERNVTVLCFMGRLYRQLNRTKQAVHCYKQCVKQYPMAIEAVLALADMNVPIQEINEFFPYINSNEFENVSNKQQQKVDNQLCSAVSTPEFQDVHHNSADYNENSNFDNEKLAKSYNFNTSDKKFNNSLINGGTVEIQTPKQVAQQNTNNNSNKNSNNTFNNQNFNNKNNDDDQNKCTQHETVPTWISDLVVAHSQLAEQNFQQANQYLNLVSYGIEGSRDCLHILLNTAQCQYGTGQTENALQTFRHIRNIDGRFIDGMDMYAYLLNEQLEITADKYYADILSQLVQQLISVDSTRAETFVAKALYFFVKNDLTAADEAVEKGLVLDPYNFWLHVTNGKIKQKCGLFEKAAEALRKAANMNGIHRDCQMHAYSGLVECLLINNKFNDAIQIAKQAVSNFPQNSKSYVLLGQAIIGSSRSCLLSDKLNYSKVEYAQNAFQKAHDLNPPGDTEAVAGLVLTKVLQHIINQRQKQTNKKNASWSDEFDEQLQPQFHSLEKIDAAIYDIRSYLGVEMHEEMVASLGVLEAYRGNYSQATLFFNQALGMAPNNELANNGMAAMAYVLSGQSRQLLLDVLVRNVDFESQNLDSDMDLEDK